MEIIAGVHDREAWEKKYQQYLSIDNPLSLCSGDYLKSEARGICYTYITPHLINTVGGNLQNPGPNDFKKAFPLCEQIPEEFPQDRGACFAGFGKEFIVLSQERDIRDIGSMTNEQLKQTYDWCMLTKDPRGQVDCINSIGNSLFWGGENSFLLPLRFCSLINNPIHNNTCYQNIINAVFFYVDNQDYLTNFCSKLPTNYQSFCQSKIRN
jgi:hypothetical protein